MGNRFHNKLDISGVEIRTMNHIVVEECGRGVKFKLKNGETLEVLELDDSDGFQIHYTVDPEDHTKYRNAGITQFKGGVIRRPGEEGFDYGN